jgi:hypothetical protein
MRRDKGRGSREKQVQTKGVPLVAIFNNNANTQTNDPTIIMQTDDHSIRIGGSVNNSQVGQTLTNCHNLIQQQASGERKALLEELERETRTLIEVLPADKQDKASKNLKLALEAVTTDPPDRSWYSVSTTGLLEAGKYVKDFTGNIAGAIGNLGKALWPDWLTGGEEKG